VNRPDETSVTPGESAPASTDPEVTDEPLPELANLVLIDKRIDAAETDGLRQRWEFGRLMLAARQGLKRLPNGFLAELVERTGKSQRELSYRAQFAERFPTEDQLRNALQSFDSWYALATHLGQSGQTSSMSGNWFTHHDITDLVRELYDGIIDLDPMSCIEANRDYVKAELFYDALQDGLRYEWCARDGSPAKVLLNPPWGGSDPTATKVLAVKKALLEFRAGRMSECVLVLNANATTTAWFEPLFEFPMCFPPRRIIVYMGPRVERFADVFSRLGNVVPPAIRRANEAARAAGEDYADA